MSEEDDEEFWQIVYHTIRCMPDHVNTDSQLVDAMVEKWSPQLKNCMSRHEWFVHAVHAALITERANASTHI